MKTRAPLVPALGTVLLGLASVSSACAAEIYWSATAGSSTWSVGANWGGTAPADDYTSDVAVFRQTSYLNQPNLTANRSVGGLVFGYSDASVSTAATAIGGSVLRIGTSGLTKYANTGAVTFSNALRFNAGSQAWVNNSATAVTVGSPGTSSGAGSATGTTAWSFEGAGSGDFVVHNVIASGTGGTTGLGVNRVGAGAGKVVLTGANTYTGGTTVTSGTLLVNNTSGSGLGNGAIAVNGGVLGGTGIIAGANSAIALNGGTLAPGAGGYGTLTGASLTWNGGASMSFDLGANQGVSDLLTLTGAFTKGAGSAFAFDFNDLGATPSMSYTLINFGSTSFADANLFTATGVGGSFAFVGNSLTFTVAAIPEPAAGALLAAGAALGCAALRRRRRA